MSDKSAAQLREQAARYLALAEAREKREREEELARREAAKPTVPHELALNGVVHLSFTKYMSGRVYHYGAVGWRVEGTPPRFAVTTTVADRESVLRHTWASLLAFIGEANWESLQVLIPDRNLIKPGGYVPPAAERMGRYGKVLGHEIVEPYLGQAGPY